MSPGAAQKDGTQVDREVHDASVSAAGVAIVNTHLSSRRRRTSAGRPLRVACGTVDVLWMHSFLRQNPVHMRCTMAQRSG